MMTLDEAIKHCNDVADSQLRFNDVCSNRSCGEEHRQLAEWLQDYKTLKDKVAPKSPYVEVKQQWT